MEAVIFFEEVAVKDRYRQKVLNEMGLTLLRFTEHDACKKRADILRNIEAYIFDFEEKEKSK